jgi:L,D-peptidoglycan transpeptidase YkuD (ErfK/YbiS/YcfS/YnhG family)
MGVIVVNTAAKWIGIDGRRVDISIGRSGACPAATKREGDGCTPIGDWPIRGVLLRPDRGMAPRTKLPWRWLRPDDGWSDDPRDPAYNRAVRHPHAFSAERLWREDGLYDAIVVLGHNDAPPVPGAGSAIFLHLREGDVTEGCLALPRETMAVLLATLPPGEVLSIR